MPIELTFTPIWDCLVCCSRGRQLHLKHRSTRRTLALQRIRPAVTADGQHAAPDGFNPSCSTLPRKNTRHVASLQYPGPQRPSARATPAIVPWTVAYVTIAGLVLSTHRTRKKSKQKPACKQASKQRCRRNKAALLDLVKGQSKLEMAAVVEAHRAHIMMQSVCLPFVPLLLHRPV